MFKEILNVSSHSAPKLNRKGFLKTLGTKILAQEDGVLNTYSKRTGDLQKLEYYSKVILTALFFVIPSRIANKKNQTIPWQICNLPLTLNLVMNI